MRFGDFGSGNSCIVFDTAADAEEYYRNQRAICGKCRPMAWSVCFGIRRHFALEEIDRLW